MKKNKPKHDHGIMDKLLAEPSVAVSVKKMTKKELELFKNLLITRGTYQRYVWEQTKNNIKQALQGS